MRVLRCLKHLLCALLVLGGMRLDAASNPVAQALRQIGAADLGLAPTTAFIKSNADLDEFALLLSKRSIPLAISHYKITNQLASIQASPSVSAPKPQPAPPPSSNAPGRLATLFAADIIDWLGNNLELKEFVPTGKDATVQLKDFIGTINAQNIQTLFAELQKLIQIDPNWRTARYKLDDRTQKLVKISGRVAQESLCPDSMRKITAPAFLSWITAALKLPKFNKNDIGSNPWIDKTNLGFILRRLVLFIDDNPTTWSRIVPLWQTWLGLAGFVVPEAQSSTFVTPADTRSTAPGTFGGFKTEAELDAHIAKAVRDSANSWNKSKK